MTGATGCTGAGFAMGMASAGVGATPGFAAGAGREKTGAFTSPLPRERRIIVTWVLGGGVGRVVPPNSNNKIKTTAWKLTE